MNKTYCGRFPVLIVCLLQLLWALAVAGQESEPIIRLESVRELFIPEGSFGDLLDRCDDRMILTREEYRQLTEEARAEEIKREEKARNLLQTQANVAPIPFVIVSSDYQIRVIDQRAVIEGELVIESFSEELIRIPLVKENVAVLVATLDDEPARMGQNSENNEFSLFIRGLGRHRLRLILTTPLIVDSTRQELNFRLPHSAKNRLRLEIPGDVELKSGALVLERVVIGEEFARKTNFELAVTQENLHFVLTLNSHKTKAVHTVLVRSLQFNEVTENDQRLHASVSLDILHQGVSQFQFVVPQRFEIKEVRFNLLDSWSVAGGLLTINFREALTGQNRIEIVAVRSKESNTEETNADEIKTWHFPQLLPVGAAANSSILALLLDHSLEMKELAFEKLIQIDSEKIIGVLPNNLFGDQLVINDFRCVGAWYAPLEDWDLAAKFSQRNFSLDCFGSIIVTIDEQKQSLVGTLSLTPNGNKLFGALLEIPPDWSINKVTDVDGQALSYDQKTVDGKQLLKVKFPVGVESGSTFALLFEASGIGSGWLGQWDQLTVDFPVFRVVGTTNAYPGSIKESGRLALCVSDDLIVVPESSSQLGSLDEEKKRAYFSDIPANLAYQYDGVKPEEPLALSMIFQHAIPNTKARCYAFYEVMPSVLKTHYELVYTVEEARVTELSFSLPEETSDIPNIYAIEGCQLKDAVDSVVSDEEGIKRRLWTLKLSGPARGTLRIGIDLEQKISAGDIGVVERIVLPPLQAENIRWQSTIVAIQGHEELDITLPESMPLRPVDVGELANANFLPGKRLLGAYDLIGESNAMELEMTRHCGYPLLPSIVQNIDARILIDPDASIVYDLYYQLSTKSLYLVIPISANMQLWSVMIDGEVIKPQRVANQLLIDINAKGESNFRTLRLVYSTDESSEESDLFKSPSSLLPRWKSDCRVSIPPLMILMGDKLEKIPVVQVNWMIIPFGGEAVENIGSSKVTNRLSRPAIVDVGEYWWNSLLSAFNHNYSYDKKQENFNSLTRDEDSLIMMVTPKMILQESEETRREDSLTLGLEVHLSETNDLSLRDNFSTSTSRRQSKTKAEKKPFRRIDTITPVKVEMQHSLLPRLPGHVKTVGDTDSNSLQIKLVDRRIIGIMNDIGSYLAVILALLLLTCSKRTRWRTLFWLVALETLLVLIPGVGVWGEVMNSPIYLLLYYALPLYLLIDAFCWIKRRCKNLFVRQKSVTATVLLPAILALFVSPLSAQVSEIDAGNIAEVIVHLLTNQNEKIEIPEDVVVIPYNPDEVSPTKITSFESNQQRVFVSTERYKKLWDLAHPHNEKTGDASLRPIPPVESALAGATYRAVLATDGISGSAGEELIVEGTLRFELFTDQLVAIELPVFGGVLDSSRLDGKNAQVGFKGVLADGGAIPSQVALNVQQSAMVQQNLYVPPATQIGQGVIYLLLVQGAGEHELTWKVRFGVQRQGGWRIVTGRLPVATATNLLLTLPEQGTELRCANLLDQRKWIAKGDQTDGTVIETTIGTDGIFHWQWRSKVTQGEIDHSLKVESETFFEVREDGYRLCADLLLTFGESHREMFRIAIPADYQVASISGQNVRGWDSVEFIPEADENQSQKIQLIDIEFLKVADPQEKISIVLWKNEDLISPGITNYFVPKVSVVDSALHRGRITVLRSKRLEVETFPEIALTRTDIPDINLLSENNQSAVGVTDSPIETAAVLSFAFNSMENQLRIVAKPIAVPLWPNIYTIVKLSDNRVDIQTNVTLNGSPIIPLYNVEILLPNGFDLEKVSPETDSQWSIRQEEEQKVLAIHFANGITSTLPLVIEGKMDSTHELSLPIFDLKGAAKGRIYKYIALLADPVYDIQVTERLGCNHDFPINQCHWLNPEYRELTRRVIVLDEGAKPSAKITLTPTKPEASVTTISNVNVGRQSVEDIVMLTYSISRAGIDQLSFELPVWMKEARIEVPFLKKKTVTPILDSEENEVAIRVDLQLQEEVTNELIVFVRCDRPIFTGQQYEVALPEVLLPNGVSQFSRATRRFVLVESPHSAGEVMIETKQMMPLNRQLKEWGYIENIFGNIQGTAYATIETEDEKSSLSFYVQQRKVVQMAGGRIGLAETHLVMGEGGVWRAEQLYHIDNRTEQYLDIRLPENSRLWGVRFLTATQWKRRQINHEPEIGMSVKPTAMPPEIIESFYMQDTDRTKAKSFCNESFVRIPLIKTEVGDPDYVIRIVYGGEALPLKSLSKIEFPLIEVRKNIHINSSVVKLQLPDNYSWQFEGSLSPLTNEEATTSIQSLKATYSKEVVDRLLTTAGQSTNDFSQIRAFNNVKEIYGDSGEVQSKIAVIEQQNDVRKSSNDLRTRNSFNLYSRFSSQSNKRSRGVLTQSEQNWSDSVAIAKSEPLSGAGEFDSGKFMVQNGLVATADESGKVAFDGSESNLQLGQRIPVAPQQTVGQEQLQSQLLERGRETISDKKAFARNSASEFLEADREHEQLLERYKSRQGPGGDISMALPVQDRASDLVYAPQSDISTLEEETVAEMGGYAGGSGGMGSGGMMGGMGGSRGMSGPMGTVEKRSGGRPAASMSSDELQVTAPNEMITSISAKTRYASLDIELPDSGKVYIFTTPRGEIELTARCFAKNDMTRVSTLFFTIIIVSLVLAIGRFRTRK